MQFLIEHEDLFGCGTFHRSIVSGLSEVHRVAAELADDDEEARRRLEALGRSSEGELSGMWGVFRFAPAA